MASQVEIYNMALMNIGQSETVASLDERSKAQQICSQWWTTARDTVTQGFAWPFATRYLALADLGSPPRNYLYRYQYPNDCLRAMYLTVDGIRKPPELLQPRFEVAWGENGQVILTDQESAELAYVVRIEETGRFSPEFTLALSWNLAAMIAMPMTATRTIADNAAAMYQGLIQQAWADARNESKDDSDPLPEYIAARF